MPWLYFFPQLDSLFVIVGKGGVGFEYDMAFISYVILHPRRPDQAYQITEGNENGIVQRDI